MTFIKSLFAGIVILAVALMARPLLVRALQLNAGTGAASPGTAAPFTTVQAADASGPLLARAAAAPDEPADMLDAVIDVRRIEGRLNAASTRRLAELLQRHPDLAAQAMRRWLAQGRESR